MQLARAALVALLLAAPLPTPPASAQTPPDSARARRGSEFLIPAASLFLPGLGQYVHRAPLSGLGFTATAAAGFAVATAGDAWGDTWEGDLPRRGRDQLAEQGVDVAFTAMSLSAWDSFQRGVPALQQRGRYAFLGPRESVGDLLSAPFDPGFLRRWTTWIDLAQTAAVAALVLSDREPGAQHHPFRGRDAAWAGSASWNAAVSEEAMFRGWLLPLLHQQTGSRFWLANGLQAGVFGAAHLPDAGWFAAYIAGWAAWEGWLVRRNDWSIRESIFHHFWYDAAIITAALLTDRRDAAVRITFPPITF